MIIISLKGIMGGAFYFAEDYAKAGKGPVYLFLNRYDAPHAAYPDRHYASHCIDISTAFRLVAYPQMEEYSRNIAKRYAAFMRTGSPHCGVSHTQSCRIS